MTPKRKQIIDHISRLEGQLASVKLQLQSDEVDCVRASTTLLSAARSFAGLRQKFTESFLLTYFAKPKNDKEQEMFSKLVALIKG